MKEFALTDWIVILVDGSHQAHQLQDMLIPLEGMVPVRVFSAWHQYNVVYQEINGEATVILPLRDRLQTVRDASFKLVAA